MRLQPIELTDLFNDDIAYEHDYARIRVGKLRAILAYQRKLEDDIDSLEASTLSYQKKFQGCSSTNVLLSNN